MSCRRRITRAYTTVVGQGRHQECVYGDAIRFNARLPIWRTLPIRITLLATLLPKSQLLSRMCASLRLSGTTLEFAALTARAQFCAIELFLDPMKRIVADDFSVTQAEN